MMNSSNFMPVVISGHKQLAGYARGGLAHAADKVAGAGRMGDSYIVHVNGKELEEMKARWGEPTVNPHTGAPEFFLGGIGDFLKDNGWMLPIAASVLAPGIGSTIGGAVNDTLGLGFGAQGTAALGNGLFGAGIGALTGGGKGALMGGLAGGLSGYMLTPSGLPDTAHGGMGPDMPKDVASSSSGGGALSSLMGGGSGNGSVLSKTLPLLALAGALSSATSKEKDAGPKISGDQQAAIDQQNKHLSNVKWDRTPTRMPSPQDLQNYGRVPGKGEYSFFKNNSIAGYAQGGDVQPQGALGMATRLPSRYVKGPGSGREDRVPAALSNDEYVVDAETVALLGDGSPEAGAKKLDGLRHHIRAHKGPALAKGKISPNAKDVGAYLKSKPQGAK